jgi:hypothetical protein
MAARNDHPGQKFAADHMTKYRYPVARIIPLIALMLAACASEKTYEPPQRWVIASDMLFSAGGYQLSANGQQTLNEYVPRLQKLHNAIIVVQGHTDNLPVGPELQRTGIDDNIDLSVGQADNVAAYLQSQGVSPNFMSVKGFGGTRPVASNDTPQGRAQNRRIEIVEVPTSLTGQSNIATGAILLGAGIGSAIGGGRGAAIGAAAGAALAGDPILASRLFAGPTQFPPHDFAAYGILAFKTRATADDTPRYEMMCNAYVAGLLHFTDVKAPLKRQMVTVWPIESDNQAIRINKMPRESLCPEAVRRYGLPTSLEAIGSARRSHMRFDDTGPYLLAWSPSETKGQPDALVLVSDLSDVTTLDQAKQLFFDWFSKIQENPELWRPGWDLAKLKILIRLWADKYGEKLLKVLGSKS